MMTGLTLPSQGAAGLQVWPNSTRIFFANQFPTDVALLHMLQLALCSPEAPTKAELSLCTGRRVVSTRTRAVGMVRQAERCPSPSLRLPWAFLAPPSSLRPPFVAMLMQVSYAACCWAGSSLRPHKLELAPQEGIALHTYSTLISSEPSALCPHLNLLELAKNCREGAG